MGRTFTGGRMEYFAFALNNWFPRVIRDVPNSELFFEAVKCEELVNQIVEQLEIIEKADDGHNWWEDKPLIRLFDDLYKSDVITLPRDAVLRIRWIALICILAAKQKQFSYGNVIIAPDYVPDEEIEEYWDRYGWDVVENIVNFRSDLRKNGWEWLLEPA